ncbi:pyridoxal-phosphate-dependent aminotransferase family protein [Candidatus Tachikawaea gelatinosa]|nr:alanine--glyoxylate aminotransferase family protein [Candidatus Tachikawaea gelatinosa]
MGAGPVNVDPRVLKAMSSNIIGQYDEIMINYMDEVMQLYRQLFMTKNFCTLIVNGTSRAGIESIFVSIIKPGDKVLVPIFGRFGYLLCEVAYRCRAKVYRIEVAWGKVFSANKIEHYIKKIKPNFLFIVHGDTSTTMLQPLSDLGKICKKYSVFFYTDATATIAGNFLKTDDWELDAVSVGMQKCLGGPSGSSPITINKKMEGIINNRKSIEEGLRNSLDKINKKYISSNYFDLSMIIDYWGAKRLNHHTESTTALFAVRECARIILEEGLEENIKRHKLHGDALLKGILGMGLKIFGDIKNKMNNVVGIIIPKKINGEQVRSLMLNDFGIEIGTSFGPLYGKIWRIGTMGYNARRDCVLQTLSALESTLHRLGFKINHGHALQEAWNHYDKMS